MSLRHIQVDKQGLNDYLEDISNKDIKFISMSAKIFGKEGIYDTVSYTHLDMDFAEIYGQEKAKRALEIVAAGNHNCLLIGPPGVGKTMLAKRLITIFPKLNYNEIIEITKTNSILGLTKEDEIINKRPFVEINPNITLASFIGGGRNPMPGAITLANLGILFMDEFAEFDSKKLEMLRTILDLHTIKLDRVHSSVKYPCKFVLIAAMNPCPCGYLGSKDKKCTCSESKIRRYLSKLSGPIVDRICLLYTSFYRLGKTVVINSIIGSLVYSLAIDLLDKFPAFTNDVFLASIYGGIFLGIGTGIVLNANATTGGTELVSNLIKTYNFNIKTSSRCV